MLYPKLKHAWPINKAPPRQNSNSSSCNGGINSNAMNKLGGRPPVRRGCGAAKEVEGDGAGTGAG